MYIIFILHKVWGKDKKSLHIKVILNLKCNVLIYLLVLIELSLWIDK